MKIINVKPILTAPDGIALVIVKVAAASIKARFNSGLFCMIIRVAIIWFRAGVCATGAAVERAAVGNCGWHADNIPTSASPIKGYLLIAKPKRRWFALNTLYLSANRVSPREY